MSGPSRIAAAVASVALACLLSACVASAAPPVPTSEPQGPLPPADTQITLERLAGVVSEQDAPPQAFFDVGEASNAGADLLSEQEYWIAVGGTPIECADVVSSPYLVSAADAAAASRIDDLTGALGTFTEDEDRYGLVQVYGRVFDDDASASGFLDAFLQVVPACGAYRFLGTNDEVTYDATSLRVDESDNAPAGTRVLTYGEQVADSDIRAVGTTFIQHKNAVVAVYYELYPSSTMSEADVEKLTSTVTGRLSAL